MNKYTVNIVRLRRERQVKSHRTQKLHKILNAQPIMLHSKFNKSFLEQFISLNKTLSVRNLRQKRADRIEFIYKASAHTSRAV